MRSRALPIAAAAALAAAWAQPADAGKPRYNRAAGKSAPKQERTEVFFDETTGERKERKVQEAPSRDQYGNARGNQFDLAVDGAFEGETVVVLHFYVEPSFDFELPKAALDQKGFSVYRYVREAPSPTELSASLEKANQLWLISDQTRRLSDEHIEVIKKFFDAGHGVYIWGDNQPYYADANAVAEALLGVTMSGDLMGDQTVRVLRRTERFGSGQSGILRDHLLTTGLEYIYEGITIATLEDSELLTPLIYGSAGNLVAAIYDEGGKRAILDGGFTRLYNKWDTAGTARYVMNAAAWLSNEERFAERGGEHWLSAPLQAMTKVSRFLGATALGTRALGASF